VREQVMTRTHVAGSLCPSRPTYRRGPACVRRSPVSMPPARR
jgi:hypothetical protein